MYAERNARGIEGAPPCEICRVELDSENEQAAWIFALVKNQVVVAGDQIIDLDFQALKAVIDIYEVQDRKRVFEKVIRTFRYFLNKSRESDDNGPPGRI